MGDQNLKWLREELVESGQDDHAWQKLLESFGEQRLSRVSQYGALLLTPDFAPQNLTKDLFRWFDRWHSFPCAVVCHRFTPAETTLLYAGRITHRSRKGRMHSGWLSPRLYAMGTSILIVLKTTDRTQPLQPQIKNAKGISRYGEHTAGDLRGMSKIADRCLSLVHTPDNYDGFFHSLDLVMGNEGTKTILEDDLEAVTEEQFAAIVPKAGLVDEPHPFELLFRLILQGVAVLIGDPRVKISRTLLTDVFERVGKERTRLATLSGQPLEGEAWKSLCGIGPELGTLAAHQFKLNDQFASWTKLKIDQSRLELCRVLQEMCNREAFDTRLSFDIVETFRRNQIELDPWDVQRLHVLAAFHGVDSASDASR